MRYGKWLASLPFIGLLAGPIFLNGVTPFIFGLPLLLAWIVLWLLLTPVLMAIVYRLDPANRRPSRREAPEP